VKLVLFDIDGTILLTDGAGKRAINRALIDVFGETGPANHRFDGKTDPQIVRELMRIAGHADERIDAEMSTLFERYVDYLQEELRAGAEDVRVMPGVRELLDVSRITSGKMTLQVEGVDLAKAVRRHVEDPAVLAAPAPAAEAVVEAVLSGARQALANGGEPAQARVVHAGNGAHRVGNRVAVGWQERHAVADAISNRAQGLAVKALKQLRAFGIESMVHDPVADPKSVEKAYGVELCDLDQLTDLSALIVAVAHDQFSALDGARLNDMIAADGVVVDVRSKIDPASLRSDLSYWSL